MSEVQYRDRTKGLNRYLSEVQRYRKKYYNDLLSALGGGGNPIPRSNDVNLIDNSTIVNLELKLIKNEGKDNIGDLIIRGNLLLVAKIAAQYLHRGLDWSDLIGAGNIGIILAFTNFDPDREVPFSSFAGSYIHTEIKNALAADGSSIRKPGNILVLEKKIYRAKNNFMSQFGRKPSDEEIAIMIYGHDNESSIDVIRDCILSTQGTKTVPLDDDNSENDMLGIIDTYPNNDDLTTLIEYITPGLSSREFLKGKLNQILTQDQLFVLIKRFGLDGNTPLGFGDIINEHPRRTNAQSASNQLKSAIFILQKPENKRILDQLQIQ